MTNKPKEHPAQPLSAFPKPEIETGVAYHGTSAVGSFICSHAVDRSLLREGFTFPVRMLYDFKSWFGTLQPGESRTLTIRLEGNAYTVKLGNRDFNRLKWPTHRDMYQMRYNCSGKFSKALREKFATSVRLIKAELDCRPDIGRGHITIPPAQREQILFYRTDDPLVWDAEVQTATETQVAFKTVKDVDEVLFESPDWTDNAASIVLKPAVVKVRRLDRAIGENLKNVYGHRCQVCGEQVAASYDAKVDEVHHIDPFVTSFNNDVSNLMVLCPNHHRIVHATHATFQTNKLAFRYPNGLEERLKINYHLGSRMSFTQT